MYTIALNCTCNGDIICGSNYASTCGDGGGSDGGGGRWVVVAAVDEGKEGERRHCAKERER